MGSLKFEDFPHPSQDGDEARKYIAKLVELRVTSVFNIGLLHGAMELWTARAFQEAGLPLSIYGVDLDGHPCIDKVRDFVRDTCPLVKFDWRACDARCLRREDLPAFEACFIDADHAYASVRMDFNLVKDQDWMVIGFHDIRTKGMGVPLFWEQVKRDYRHEEFCNHPDVYGIGVIYQ